ncbi:MAG: hypothetical protein K0R29_1747 [Pseudobdellovibrio sp.]|jgi:hypothetical protein|nr:hypothetical protein [Pseudobdellovibrio sp.]
MKLLVIILASAFLFSCQKSSDNSSNGGSPGRAQPESTQSKKTLKFSEILEQDLSAKETLNWGNAESFKATDENESEMVKFSYFFQENKLIKSKDIEKSKGYCELNTLAAANANGSEINLTAGANLYRFMDFRSEKTEINNLNYKYDAMFRLTFQILREAGATSASRQFQLACYNVLDLAELKAAIDSKFNFKKREEKETK